MHSLDDETEQCWLLAAAIAAAVEEAAQEALANGRARLTQGTRDCRPWIELQPVELSAAPLETYIETGKLAALFPGHNGMVHEVFSVEPAEIAAGARSLCKAVVEGRYTERVNDAGSRTKISARWPDGDSYVSPSLNVLRVPKAGSRRARNWRTVTYEPY